MYNFFQEIRQSARSLIKRPGLTFVAIFTLALAIGANTAIFSIFDAVVLRSLPYTDGDQLVVMWESFRQTQEKSVSYPNYQDWRAENNSFSNMGAYSTWSFSLTGEGEAERLTGAIVSSDLFPTLGASPLLGRLMLSEEDSTGAQPVAILSYGLWQRRFGGDADIIGRKLTLNDLSATVIGVMPRDFAFPYQTTEVWMPLVPAVPDDLQQRGNHLGLYVIGRLRPGITHHQAREDMERVGSRLAERYPATNAEHNVALTTLRERLTGELRTPFFVLLAAIGFVLAVACANVANLLIARASERSREIAIRMALGASRLRIIRQLMTESLLLSLTAGAIGVLLAAWAIDPLRALVPDGNLIPGLDGVGIDARMLAFTFGVSSLTGLIFGIMPALYATRDGIRGALAGAGRSTVGAGQQRLRSALVISEVALSLVLLVGAGLMMRTMWQLARADLGFNSKNVVTIQTSVNSSGPQDQAGPRFFSQLIERTSSIPGVEVVGAAHPLPLAGSHNTQIQFVDSAVASSQEFIRTDFARVAPDYFRAMQIPLVRGRPFTERDSWESPRVAIIDETTARQFFPDSDPIGRQVRAANQTWEIVGVIGHVRNYGIREPSRYEIFFPYRQLPTQTMAIVLRTEADTQLVTAAVREMVREINPNQPIYNIRSMDSLVERTLATERTTMILLGVFALVAILLAAVGLYGVMSSIVTQRTNEIGVRIAIGAKPSDILKMILGRGFTLTMIGVMIGLAGSLALTRMLSSLLYGVGATDPATFCGVSLLLVAIALVACYLPARRATRVDPVVALRYE